MEEDDKVKEVGIYFQPRNPPTNPEYFSFLPAKPFTGKLLVDGGEIHKDIVDPTMIQKRPPPWRHGYRPRLYSFDNKSSRPPIHAVLDTNIGGGIFEFGFSYRVWADPKGSQAR